MRFRNRYRDDQYDHSFEARNYNRYDRYDYDNTLNEGFTDALKGIPAILKTKLDDSVLALIGQIKARNLQHAVTILLKWLVGGANPEDKKNAALAINAAIMKGNLLKSGESEFERTLKGGENKIDQVLNRQGFQSDQGEASSQNIDKAHYDRRSVYPNALSMVENYRRRNRNKY